MSVIIQGLKLPAYQGEHKEFDRYGCFLTVYKTGKVELHIFEKDFDVKDIPTPHGRLIDADALMECRLEPNHYEELKDGYIPDYDLDSAPTIIEAEVSAE